MKSHLEHIIVSDEEPPWRTLSREDANYVGLARSILRMTEELATADEAVVLLDGGGLSWHADFVAEHAAKLSKELDWATEELKGME